VYNGAPGAYIHTVGAEADREAAMTKMLAMTHYPVERFHWSREEAELSCEISDLGPGFRFERIYDDACDLGIAIRGTKGGVWKFALADSDKDAEGCIVRCRLVPVDSACPVRAVFLFND
jgi:hypothetical protein